jgi:hypothetical protein
MSKGEVAMLSPGEGTTAPTPPDIDREKEQRKTIKNQGFYILKEA